MLHDLSDWTSERTRTYQPAMDAEAKLDSLVKNNPNVTEVPAAAVYYPAAPTAANISNAFAPPPRQLKLEYSALDNQQFEQLLPKFAKLKSLQTLNLSRNRLSALPKVLCLPESRYCCSLTLRGSEESSKRHSPVSMCAGSLASISFADDVGHLL